MTSLDRQLKSIKEKIHYVDVTKKRASLLFNEVEAANIDLDAVLAMGQEGLEELINIDVRFKCFQLTLFADTSKTFNRVLEVKEENDKIDIEINKFLELQSNYFLSNSAHKALEWLIRRYRINEFNIDSVLSSIIPYHESNIFAKFLSILQFEFNKKWEFLTNVQENKVYIPREYFIKITGSHPFFLDFILSTVETYDRNNLVTKPLVSFFTAFLIELLTVKTTPHLKETLACLLKCLKSNNTDLLLGTLYDFNSAFTFLMVLFQKQKFDSLSNSTLELLVSIPALFEILFDFHSQEKSLDRLLLILFKYLSSNIVESAECYTLLSQLITDLPNTQQYHSIIFNKIISTYILKNKQEKEESDESIISIARLLNNQIVQEEIEKLIKQQNNNKDKLVNFQKLIFEQKTISTSQQNTIFLKLESTIPSERKDGLQLFKQLYSEESDKSTLISTLSSSFSDTIYSRLVDSDHSVAKDAWALPKLYQIVVSKDLIKASNQFFKNSSFTNDDKLVEIVLLNLLNVVKQQQSTTSDILAVLFSQLFNESVSSLIISKFNKELNPIFNNVTTNKNKIETVIKSISNNINSEQSLSLLVSVSKSTYSTFNSDLFLLLLIQSVKQQYQQQSFKLAIEVTQRYINNDSSKETQMNQFNNIQDIYTAIKGSSAVTKPIQIGSISHVLCLIIENLQTIQAESLIKELSSNAAITSTVTTANASSIVQLIQSLCKLIFNSKVSNIDSVLKVIIKKFFSNQLVFFKFLSNFWQQPVTDFNSVYQSLCLSGFLVNSKAFSRYILSNQTIIVPFISLLKSNESSIRSTSLESIQEIYNQIKTTTASASKNSKSDSSIQFYAGENKPTIDLELLSKFLLKLTQYKKEFSMDKEFLDSYFSKVLFNPSNTIAADEDDEDEDSSDEETNKAGTNNTDKFTLDEVKTIGKFLVSSSLNIESIESKLSFISSLQSVDDVAFVETTSEYLQALLEKAKNKTLVQTESKILDILLKKLGSSAVLNSSKLKKSHNVFSLFLSALSISNDIEFTNTKTKYSPLRVAIASITKNLLLTIPIKEQINIVEIVLSYFFSENQQVKDVAKNALLSVLVDGTVILPMLLPEKETKSSTPAASLPIPRYNSLFELIRLNSSKIGNVSVLINPIQLILKKLDVNTVATGEVTVDAIEYCKQLAMASLGSICEQSTSAKDIKSIEGLYDISIIIKCVESTKSLQTCNSALLLLSNLASKFPQKLFKFMDSIIGMIKFVLENGDDNFSFMILQKFLSQLLPSLVKQGISLASIFKLFLESFATIPKSFRLQLFNSVCQSVSYSQFHILLCLILIKKIQDLRIITKKLKPLDKDTIMSSDDQIKEEVDYDQFNDFVSVFCDQVPVLEMSTSLANLCLLLNQLSIETGSCIEPLSEEEEIVYRLLSNNNSKDNRLLQVNTLDFICERLSSKVYLDSFSVSSAQERQTIENQYLLAFENLLVLLKKTTEYSEKTIVSTNQIKLNGSNNSIINQVGKDKFIKKILSSINLCMDRLSQLLSVPGFISTITQLLEHSDSNVRRRSLVIFNEKITLIKEDIEQEQVDQFLCLIDSFARILESSTETEANKQTALLSFEILARNFSSSNPTVFLSQIPIIIKSMGHSSHQVVSSSLICIATLCSELQAKTIPYIPQFFPVLLNTLTGSYKTNHLQEENETRTLLQISCISSLEMMLNTISKFLSPYLPQLLNALLHPRLTSNSLLSGKLLAQIKRLLSLLTKNVEFRLLLPAMFTAYEFAVQSENDQSLICLFDFVGEISLNLGPKDIALHHKSIFKFYLQCFEFRKKYKDRVKNADKIEDHIISSFMTLVMKLNENLFKPLFIKVLDWALTPQQQQQNGNHHDEESEEDDNSDSEEEQVSNKKKKVMNGKSKPVQQQEKSKDNLLFFYKIVNSLSSNLKTIFVPYFGYFLDDSIRQLQSIFNNTPLKNNNNIIVNETNNINKRKLLNNNNNINNNINNINNNNIEESILCFVISALEKCFMYDTDGFLDKQKFEQVLPALANQLENQMGTIESYNNRVKHYLAPCITQLAVAINQDLLWKHLNHTILMKTRSPYSIVRYSAMVVINSLHRRMGEQLLILLPETIPFISELLEDSVPDVERITQETIKEIEKHLGSDESIKSYL
ncbi:hypothetical protein DICPUDRAFT_149273 [Dictyostelium purpureum]|uniref:HEAT repeat-containing protein 1 n=1 Tax=Dictyostelium purpureum TaxID=5786 RepID=F0ZD97_DICPU|nr:uncharacterized protein DICPUDRAFT_149273 [Dictyostelium purpureum]EGC38069.1 hypothetical protein DICPUDRAFT_149273 [Dictyostelium purpureum]|eukprot:XP_003285376.1 hypothetical protein DICPUDRAFT_149273 [Dictyostelium purpureum]